MRYSPQHKEATRERLLKATGAVVKGKGFSATGIDELMAAAGLTSGAFYAHFRTKGDLLEAIVEQELQRSIELFSNKTFEQRIASIESYLSPAHVEHPASGCAIPALAPEIARASAATQHTYEQGVLELKQQLSNLVSDDAKAWSIMSQMIGAVMIARAIPSPATREALLSGVKQQIVAQIQAP